MDRKAAVIDRRVERHLAAAADKGKATMTRESRGAADGDDLSAKDASFQNYAQRVTPPSERHELFGRFYCATRVQLSFQGDARRNHFM